MIYRIDVRTLPSARDMGAGTDPVGEAVRQQIKEFGTTIGPVSTRRIFLIDTDADESQVRRIAQELLADPIVEQADLIQATRQPEQNGHSRIEIHLKPGVMDPVAASTEMAIRDMGLAAKEVRTGRAYLIDGQVPRAELEQIASKVLANGVIESVHFDQYVPEQFEAGHEYRFKLKHVPIAVNGKPVIAGRIGAVQSIVDEGEDAFTVDIGDAAALATKIQVLVADEHLRVRMGRNGRTKVQQRYTWDIVTAKLRAVYEKVQQP